MKLFKTLLTILFISLLSSPSWSAAIDDLVERNDLYYEKFTNVPFTAKITGQEQGSIKIIELVNLGSVLRTTNICNIIED
jgi:hypothetical protein